MSAGAIKPGVVLPDVLALAVAHTVVVSLFLRAGFDWTLTSGIEGRHGSTSFHPEGRALDYRARHMPEARRVDFAAAARERLGPQFDFQYETSPPHFHLEVDLKGWLEYHPA